MVSEIPPVLLTRERQLVGELKLFKGALQVCDSTGSITIAPIMSQRYGKVIILCISFNGLLNLWLIGNQLRPSKLKLRGIVVLYETAIDLKEKSGIFCQKIFQKYSIYFYSL